MNTEKLSSKIFKTFSIILILSIVGYLSYLLINIIIILAVSVLFAYILKPLVKYLETIKIQKQYAALIVIIFTIIFIAFLLYYFIPQLTLQFENFLSLIKNLKIPDKLVRFEKNIEKIFPLIKAKDLSIKIDTLLQDTFTHIINQIYVFVGNIFSIVFTLVIIPFITFFILKDGKQIKLGIINILPNKYFEAAYLVIEKVDIELGKYVRGWILDAAFVGFASLIGLYLIGIPNFAMIGLIAGLGHLIPYLGPVFGAIPAILVSLYETGDFSGVPLIILLFALIYIIDNGFIQPYLYSKNINMHPVVIIILIAIGSELFGVLGMFLAVPFANTLRVTAAEIYHSYRKFKIVR